MSARRSFFPALAVSTLSLGLGAQSVIGPARTAKPLARDGNVLFLVMDEIGPDMIGVYPWGTDKPPTPSLDALANGGVRFENAYSNPAGSCTMATLETGRISELTGIGFTIYESLDDPPLPLAETILPEMLDLGTKGLYETAFFGKWFLGRSEEVGGINAPLVMGYDHYEGVMEQLYVGGFDYFTYPWVDDGVETLVTDEYVTTKTVDEVLDWIGKTPEPWFCHVAFNACHTPYHIPPEDLFTVTLPPVINPHKDLRPVFKAMTEALDTEIGRLVNSLDPEVRERTTIIVLSDNGTPQGVVAPPLLPDHGKLTVYEGGVHIPLIVNGNGVNSPGRTVDALVQTTDLFDTVAELAGVDIDAVLPGLLHQSVGIGPYLQDPLAAPMRDKVFAQMFYPNGVALPSYTTFDTTARDERFKLVRRWLGAGNPVDELFDLSVDPFELNDLLAAGPLSPEAQAAYLDLRAYILGLIQLP